MTCAWRSGTIPGSRSADRVDRDLLAGWLAARSIARGVPAPIADHGGWRVDTRSDAEWCRYVFAAPDGAITDLARSIERPRIFLKLCAEKHALRRLLPQCWRLLDDCWVMIASTGPEDRPLPAGYAATIDSGAGAIHVSIAAPDGTLAASGYAAEAAGVFAYDRITTSPDHRRRGLGSAVMALLRSCKRSHASDVLVATDQGRALYTALGWQVHAPYASAVIPDPGS